MIGNDQDGMSHGQDSPFSTTPGGQAMILSRQVSVFGFAGCMRCLNQSASKGRATFTSRTTQALTATLVVARRNPGPSGQVIIGGKPGHVRADFRQDHLSDLPANTRNGIQISD